MDWFGYWEPTYREGVAVPQDSVVPTWDTQEREKVASYLGSGVVSGVEMGYYACLFECGIDPPEQGSKHLADGVWVWPESLVHYVQSHAVKPPKAFLNHMKRNKMTVPRSVDVGLVHQFLSERRGLREITGFE